MFTRVSTLPKKNSSFSIIATHPGSYAATLNGFVWKLPKNMSEV